MKICPKCNATFDDEVQFCTVCGQPMPEAAEAAPIPPTYQPSPDYYGQKSEGETVSTGKWLLYQLIPIIPVVGGIIYIVMLFVWGFGDSAKNETFRNWARSKLILAGISLVIGILMIVLVVIFSVGMFGALGVSEVW